MLEIGSGTGVLSAILSKFVSKSEIIHALDINPEAVKTVEMNSHILNLHEKITAHELDIVALAEADEATLDKILDRHK